MNIDLLNKYIGLAIQFRFLGEKINAATILHYRSTGSGRFIKSVDSIEIKLIIKLFLLNGISSEQAQTDYIHQISTIRE
jgi:hypothetical protein